MTHVTYIHVLVRMHIIFDEIVGNFDGGFNLFLGKGPTIFTDIILSLESFMKLEKRQHYTVVNYLLYFTPNRLLLYLFILFRKLI